MGGSNRQDDACGFWAGAKVLVGSHFCRAAEQHSFHPSIYPSTHHSPPTATNLPRPGITMSISKKTERVSRKTPQSTRAIQKSATTMRTAKRQHLQRTSKCAKLPASTSTSEASAHLEMARARAFQAGILPVAQFLAFSSAHPFNAPWTKPPPIFSERLYAAARKLMPEHVRQQLCPQEQDEQKARGGGKEHNSNTVSIPRGNSGRHGRDDACQSRSYRKSVVDVLFVISLLFLLFVQEWTSTCRHQIRSEFGPRELAHMHAASEVLVYTNKW